MFLNHPEAEVLFEFKEQLLQLFFANRKVFWSKDQEVWSLRSIKVKQDNGVILVASQTSAAFSFHEKPERMTCRRHSLHLSSVPPSETSPISSLARGTGTINAQALKSTPPIFDSALAE